MAYLYTYAYLLLVDISGFLESMFLTLLIHTFKSRTALVTLYVYVTISVNSNEGTCSVVPPKSRGYINQIILMFVPAVISKAKKSKFLPQIIYHSIVCQWPVVSRVGQQA